jgi:hypothetical protein
VRRSRSRRSPQPADDALGRRHVAITPSARSTDRPQFSVSTSPGRYDLFASVGPMQDEVLEADHGWPRLCRCAGGQPVTAGRIWVLAGLLSTQPVSAGPGSPCFEGYWQGLPPVANPDLTSTSWTTGTRYASSSPRSGRGSPRSRQARRPSGACPGSPVYAGRRSPTGGVSVEYYTRLERGNLAGASEGVLQALATTPSSAISTSRLRPWICPPSPAHRLQRRTRIGRPRTD